MEGCQPRAKNSYGEKDGSRGMPVLTDDDAGQKHHEASEERAHRVAETNLHSFVHSLFSYPSSVVRGRIRPDDELGWIGRAVVGE